MIVWGGNGMLGLLATGGRYDATLDTWASTSSSSAPQRRHCHTAVWTGTRMIVWGGSSDLSPFTLGNGAAYDPLNDQWDSSPSASSRYQHTAVWADDRMVVWGGRDSNDGIL